MTIEHRQKNACIGINAYTYIPHTHINVSAIDNIHIFGDAYFQKVVLK